MTLPIGAIPFVRDNALPAHTKTDPCRITLIALAAIGTAAFVAVGIAAVVIGNPTLIITSIVLAVAAVAFGIGVGCYKPKKETSTPVIQPERPILRPVTPAPVEVRDTKLQDLRMHLAETLGELNDYRDHLFRLRVDLSLSDPHSRHDTHGLTKSIFARLDQMSHPLNCKVWQQIVEEILATSTFLAKAAENAKKAGNNNEIKKSLDRVLQDLAESFYQSGDLEGALWMVSKIVYTNKKTEDFISKLANAFYARKETEQALTTIGLIQIDFIAKDAFYETVANDFYKNGDRRKAVELIQHVCDFRIKYALCIRAANDYYKDEKLIDDALWAMSFVHDRTTSEAFYKKVADHLYQRGKKEKAGEVIDKILLDQEAKGAFYREAAKKHRTQAFEADNKDIFHLSIAEDYFQAQKYKEAGTAITKVNDPRLTGPFYRKLADTLIVSDRNSAFEYIRRIIFNDQLKNEFLAAHQM